MPIDENDALVLELLSAEKKKQLLKTLGLLPQLPEIIRSIDDDTVYSTQDVAELLNCSPQKVTRLCRQNKLEAYQSTPRGKYSIFGQHIKKLLEQNFHRPSIIVDLAEKFLNK